MRPPSSIDVMLAETLERPPGPERDSWIEEACGGDDRLERKLRSLLDCHERAGSFMATPLVDLPSVDAPEAPVPSHLGPYRIEAEIGRGGMGVVRRAVDTRLDRMVAIKMLPALLTDHPTRLARLEQEARTLAALNHPNIELIHGFEEHDGRRILVLEYVDGDTLADRLARGPLPIDETLHVCAQIAAAIEASHDAGVVHRDLKPSNVMITPDGRVKVLDFGLAKTMAEFGSSATPRRDEDRTPGRPDTVPGAIVGTAAYMSPEQTRGQALDGQTDVWSFGVILHECLTGVGLFRAETAADSITAVLTAKLTLEGLPPETPAIVRYLLADCLQRDKTKRLRDMRNARLALQHESSATDLSPVLPHRSRRLRSLRAVAVAAVAVIVITASLLIAGRGGSTPPAAATRTAPGTVRLAVPVTVPKSLWGGKRIVLRAQAPGGESTMSMLLWGHRFVAVAISPDGDTIAYIGVDSGDTSASPVPGIYVRPLHSAEATRLPGTDDAARLSFSPDGSQFAFVWWDRESRRTEVRRVGVDGGPVTMVLAASTGDDHYRYSTPTWLSNDELLIVTWPSTALHRVPLDTGEPIKVADFGHGDNENLQFAYHPVPTPDRRSVLLTTLRSTPDGPLKSLVRVDVQTGTWRTVLEDAEYGVVVPGGHLLFVRRSALCVAPLELDSIRVSGPPREIVAGVAAGPFACSENGTLVFARDVTDDLERPLMTIDRDGRKSPLGDVTGAFRGIRTAPDGRSLIVEVADPSGDVHARMFDLDTQRLLPAADPGPDASAELPGMRSALSPDGRWLAYTKLVSGDQYHVFIRRFDPADPASSPEHRVSLAVSRDPFWSADGSELYFINEQFGDIMRTRFDATAEPPCSEPETLVRGSRMGKLRTTSTALRKVDVVPDGRFVYVGKPIERMPSHLDVALNWLDELRAKTPAE